ncbi:hypothetical protein TNCV_30091 [Trichonephila clavipes]|nr:hypothetical protein TNCV_30091 [Trichonephila clavipes]
MNPKFAWELNPGVSRQTDHLIGTSVCTSAPKVTKAQMGAVGIDPLWAVVPLSFVNFKNLERLKLKQ